MIEVERGKGKGNSAGGSYSNVNDMLRFSNALRKNLIVSGETLKNMTSAKNNNMVVTDPWSGQYVGASYSKTSYKSTLAGITCG